MRIGMILDGPNGFPPDIRVEKEAKALVAAGHQVFILCPTGRRPPGAEIHEQFGVTVVRVALLSSKGTYVLNAWRSLTMFDERWLCLIQDFVSSYSIETLHVHDLPLVPVAIEAARRGEIPVIADLHENMPAAERAYRSGYGVIRRLHSSIFKNYWLMRYLERRALLKCRFVIVVVPEASERIIGYGVPPERVVVVSNTEDETTFDSSLERVDFDIINRYKNKFVISYVGTIGAHRGLETVLRAIPRCADKIRNLKLVIVGADPSSFKKINNILANYGIESLVDLYGWVPFKKAQSFIKASDVCLVPHDSFEHTNTTIPHKLFQYMICGRPVLVSDCKPLKRVVESASCGRTFKAGDPHSFSLVLTEMYENRRTLAAFGQSGKDMALTDYSWRHDARALVNVFETLAAEVRNRK
jgi:glycosyltransferase involved in cell wall biosynthesis